MSGQHGYQDDRARGAHRPLPDFPSFSGDLPIVAPRQGQRVLVRPSKVATSTVYTVPLPASGIPRRPLSSG
ncbi:MAG: hypothetical protein ACRDQ5_21335 [Sciscionella sp.]